MPVCGARCLSGIVEYSFLSPILSNSSSVIARYLFNGILLKFNRADLSLPLRLGTAIFPWNFDLWMLMTEFSQTFSMVTTLCMQDV